jgi:hypothetical protein
MQKKTSPEARCPDSRIDTKRQHLPMLFTSTVVAKKFEAPSRFAPRLQWRYRVGLAPTSHDHWEASVVRRSIAWENDEPVCRLSEPLFIGLR